MGIEINVNVILRQEVSEPLEVGGEYTFVKDELTVVADDIQTWLTAKDWTALAEIQVTSQQRKDGKTVGTYVVKHVYDEQESSVLTSVFRRMYGWE